MVDFTSLGSRNARHFAWIVVAISWIYLIGLIAARGRDYQRDFRTYYYAARTWEHSLNPYDIKAVNTVSGGGIANPFIYPAATLPFFHLFTYVPYSAAQYIWLAFKVLSLVALVVLWRRTFLREVDLLVVLFYSMLAFNNTVFQDLVDGNVTLIEQVLLWAGFWCYMRGRRIYFAVFIVLASAFKLTPIVFLGLLILDRERSRKSLLLFSAGVASLALIVLGPMLPHPGWLYSLFAGATKTTLGYGRYNPCALAFFHELSTKDVVAPIFSRFPYLFGLLWGLYSLLIVALSWRPISRAIKGDNRLAILMLTILVYALTLPRMKDYSYVLLIVPSLILVYALRPSVSLIVPASVVICMPMYLTADYYPWLLALTIWFLFVSGIVKAERIAPELRAPVRPVSEEAG